MANVNKSRAFEVPADEMWVRVGDFHRLQSWLPGIEKEEKLEDGTARRLTLGNGVQMVEQLLGSEEREYRYSITEGPLPVTNYVSTLRVREIGPKECVVEWSSEFEPAGVPEEQAVAIIEAIYDAGLNALSVQ